LAIHSGQKAFENQDQHHCQCHPANAQHQARLVLEKITAGEKHSYHPFTVTNLLMRPPKLLLSFMSVCLPARQ